MILIMKRFLKRLEKFLLLCACAHIEFWALVYSRKVTTDGLKQRENRNEKRKRKELRHLELTLKLTSIKKSGKEESSAYLKQTTI